MEQQQTHSMKCPSCGKQWPAGTAFCPQDGLKLLSAPHKEPRTDSLLGTHVSEYVIQERIGAGGMGIVYRAIQPLIGKQVAIKILKAEIAESPELVERLLVEARAVNSIRHRGVIDIFGFGQLPDGRPYVVMELLQGMSLFAFIRKRKRLAPEEAVTILDEMLAALGAAHREGIIHRDLKPGNVFLVESSEGVRSVKLLDFGIAKVAELRASRPLTVTGRLMGTPEYMAPEQVRGEKVEPTSDLYAVGVIAFQMLTGRLPFSGDQMRVLMAHLEEQPPALSSLAPDVPKVLESIVMRLLAKSPSDRYASAEAVRRELSQLLPSREGSLTTAPEKIRALARQSSKPATLSHKHRTLELPALAATEDEPETLTTELTSNAVARPKRAKPRWLLGVGVTALASAGIVGFWVLHRSPPVPEQTTQAPQAVSVPPDAPQALNLPSPQPTPPPAQQAQPVAVAAAAPAEAPKPPPESPPQPKKVESPQPQQERKVSNPSPPSKASPSAPVARKALARTEPARAGTSTRAASSTSSTVIDQPTLMLRLLDAEERLLKINPTACPVTSPAMARLRELQKHAREAGTEQQRLKLVGLLADWEQQFMARR